MFASCIVVTIKVLVMNRMPTYLHVQYMTLSVLTERLLQQMVRKMAANLYVFSENHADLHVTFDMMFTSPKLNDSSLLKNKLFL